MQSIESASTVGSMIGIVISARSTACSPCKATLSDRGGLVACSAAAVTSGSSIRSPANGRSRPARDTERAMSQENVELVRRGIESVEAFWALLDDDVVWDLGRDPPPDIHGVYVGRDSVIEASRRYWGTWDAYSLDADELIDAGSSVVVVVHERGRGRGSGAPFDRRWAQVWTFREGRIIRWELFVDKAEALEAAGLSE
jgi:uncharacterized protein